MFLPVAVCLFISHVVAQSNSTFYGCDFIQSFASCDRFITDSYCGTNIVTYNNRCEFTKAHCKDPSIDLLHVGDCSDLDIATATPVPGNEVIVDFFCTSLSKTNCPTEIEKVCATDGRTYNNYCEYEKAKCTHRDIGVASYGDCPV
ncbi:serine protease inhibitor dipetalogastin-like isoform X2 [Mercenaria mercenaria]|uniref:serine protease inhibitor dipetalogastin-like isoform X2 n=1 Tax=Mercenaria mercenaria TaxID=6596 RepID=UPI001E1E0974|nr:serine protease inhibitor dipetalogastin-like isoform X2 [Mercenaria mercenaria]